MTKDDVIDHLREKVREAADKFNLLYGYLSGISDTHMRGVAEKEVSELLAALFATNPANIDFDPDPKPSEPDFAKLTPYRSGLDWKTGYCTRDGRPVRILADDLSSNDYPIIAAVTDKDGETSSSYTADGHYYDNRCDDGRDLMCKPVTKTIWVSVYSKDYNFQTLGNGYFAREDADRSSGHARIACVPLTYTEGEGLNP
jgi:hypothetical protein